MIPLEGRVVDSFDEFMLRLGHLTVLCQVAEESRSARAVVEKQFAAKLASMVPIPKNLQSAVAAYLQAKGLCALGEDASLADRRYPNIQLAIGQDGLLNLTAKSGEPLAIQQQDFWFADPALMSRVGAISLARSRNGGKTGVSHIFDWAIALELLGTGGQVYDEARLILWARNQVDNQANPYILDAERLVYFYLYLLVDFDFFSRLLPRLAESKGTLAKKDALGVFGAVMRDIAAEADADAALSTRARYRIIQTAKEVGALSDDPRVVTKSKSIAWHRAAARYETLVDVGILKRGTAAVNSYRYAYEPTEHAVTLADTLRNGTSALQWIMKYSVFAVASTIPEVPVPATIPALAKEAAIILRRPLSLIPIGSLSLYISLYALLHGGAVSLAESRRAIEAYAIENPASARLSRGGSGDQAEFFSLTQN